MKAILNKVDNGYVLLVDNIMYATDNDKLSKQNCDSLFGVVDVEKLAEEWYDGNGKSIYTDYNTMPSFIAGFNKAMELNQPTEIEVEIEMQCLDPNCDGANRKGICIPGNKPKLDENGCLILKKVMP